MNKDLNIADLQRQYQQLCSKFEVLQDALQLESNTQLLQKLNFQAASSEFWQQPPSQQSALLQQKSLLEKKLKENKQLVHFQQEISSGFNLINEGEDANLILPELQTNFENWKKLLLKLEIELLLNEEFDNHNVILQINPGAGGVESQDWVEMLLRMYLNWAQKNEYSTKVLDMQAGQDAGLKSVTLNIIGPQCYGWLKSENGVHRLVRISPFDAAKRRHTSFASVAVSPEIDDLEITIDPKDLKIDTLRSSGAGGQHVNTTDSAVRITHIPSGLVVKSQAERSQHKNKQLALKILRSNLHKLQQQQKQSQQKDEHSSKMDIDFGSQIRSYILYPYQLVKDHRFGCQTSNTTAVLDGDIDVFLYAALNPAKEDKATDVN